MPKPNYQFEKRQREIEKKRKKAEKAQRKATGSGPDQEADQGVEMKAPSGQLCPLCGGTNDCEMAASGDPNAACWCRKAEFSAEVLARVPEAEKGLACICKRCAQGLPAQQTP